MTYFGSYLIFGILIMPMTTCLHACDILSEKCYVHLCACNNVNYLNKKLWRFFKKLYRTNNNKKNENGIKILLNFRRVQSKEGIKIDSYSI